MADYSLFSKRSTHGILLILVYVDDIIIYGHDEEEINQQSQTTVEELL